MAARDRYELKVGCPECGVTAIAKVSEEDHPYISNLDRQMTIPDQQFDVVAKGNNLFNVICHICRTEHTIF